MNNTQPFLTIGIPTFNRDEKLDRLLYIIIGQIKEENLEGKVQIFVSDNGSNDLTKLIVQKHTNDYEFIRYKQHEFNQGFDFNILSIYKSTSSEYLWLLADDDIPIPGSITKIYNSLLNNLPDILLFSFGQPPKSKKGVFDFDENIYISKNIKESIELVMRWPKVSVYVFKTITLTKQLEDIIHKHNGDGWNHVVIGLTILYSVKPSKVNIISEVLAHCDEDFDMLTWSPKAIEHSYKLALHPLIQDLQPELLKKLKFTAYINAIQFSFAAKIGTLRVQNIKEYDDFIKKIPWKLIYLVKKPKSFIQFILLKMKITNIYPKKKTSKSLQTQ
jgi:glycosyltransferase involved in cell wall biosynthesis